jgi:hypothetical protein
MNKKKVAGVISRLINELHGIDKQKPLVEGVDYYLPKDGQDIQLTQEFFDNWRNERQKEASEKILKSKGVEDMMASPLMSSIFKSNPARQQKQSNVNSDITQQQMGKKQEEQEETSVKEDTKHTKIGPDTSQSLRVNDSEADILGKMFNFMKRDYEFRSNMEKDKEKYRKEVGKRKDAYTDQLIEALTGKKPSKSKKSGITSKKSGLLKYAVLGAAGAGAFMLSKSALANVDWKAMLPDFDFSKIKTDGEEMKTNGVGTGAMGGPAAGDWKNDTEFLNNVNKYAQEKGIKASDLLGVMAAESKIDPTAVNKVTGATGLIQFMPKTAKGLGTSTEELSKMSRSQQFEFVKKHLDQSGLKSGSSAGEIYSKVFLPGRSKSEILTKQGENYYEGNKGLDVDKSGDISKTDLEKVAQSNIKKYNIVDVVPEQTAVQNQPANKSTPSITDASNQIPKSSVEVLQSDKVDVIPQKIKVSPKKPTQVSVIGNSTNIVNGATNYNVAGTTNNNNASLVDKQYYNYG